MLKPEISVSYSCSWVLKLIIFLPMSLIPEVPKFITLVLTPCGLAVYCMYSQLVSQFPRRAVFKGRRHTS